MVIGLIGFQLNSRMDMENKANNELIILYLKYMLKYILYILYLLENILNNENYIIRIQALSLI